MHTENVALSYQRVPLAFLALLTTAAAQTHAKPHPAAAEAKPDELPITRVALYKNGVGFFEHAGRVTGDHAFPSTFRSHNRRIYP